MKDADAVIRRSARRLRYATLAGIGVLALGFLIALWVLVSGQAQMGSADVRVGISGLPPRPAAATGAVFILLLGMALQRLARMLRKVEEGQTFRTARDLHGFAFFLFLTVLVSILLPPLAHLMFGPAGSRTLSFSMSGDQALMLLVTGLLFLVARLLDEAQRLAEDHSQIV